MVMDSYQRHLSGLSGDTVKDQNVTIINEIVVKVMTTEFQAHFLVFWSHINSQGPCVILKVPYSIMTRTGLISARSGGCSHMM